MHLKSIAYFMHVHWNWIKQRPHFLYEELAKKNFVDLYYVRKFHEKSLSDNHELLKIPFSSTSGSLLWLEKKINRRKINLNKNYDVVWITSPVMMQFIPEKFLEDKLIIYDCMDDYLEFDVNKKDIRRNYLREANLVKIADNVLTSSGYLKEKIMSRYADYLQKEPICVNNGISSEFIPNNLTETDCLNLSYHESGIFNLTYIGTIGEWFDKDLILEIINNFDKVVVTLVGPIQIDIFDHPRLVKMGQVHHRELPEIAKKADAFIMPFILNELVLSVDPVKIYEYISFNKPIISVRYDEILRFEQFLFTYSNRNELLNIIGYLINGGKKNYSLEDAILFLKNSTWETRVEQISSKVWIDLEVSEGEKNK